MAVLALAFASPAMAQDSIPTDNSGGDQYVPPVPDARGNRPSGPNSGNPGHLSPRARASLPSGVEGQVLARLATDPGSGAPSDVGSGGDGSSSGGTAGTGAGGSGGGGGGGADGGGALDGGGGASGGKAASEGGATAASAISSAVSDNPSIVALVLALLALTLASAAFGIARRRRHS